jgi:uncharacterized SAM-binding protein YcdF (DUF218 family)
MASNFVPEAKAAALRSRRGRLLLRTAAWGAAAVLLWAATGLLLYVAPAADAPRPADVLFVLAPQGDRTRYAEHLMDQGYAGTLAISAPQDKDGTAALCKEKRTYRIVCFDPDPVTTQGEARALQRLSKLYGWKSANVLTAQFHVTRARILLQRCYQGDLGMIAFSTETPLLVLPYVERSSWTYHFVYETAAFVKVAINQDC